MELRFLPLLLVLGMTGYAGEPRPAKPNIIIMMADDMGLGDTSAYLDVRLSPDFKPITKTLRTPNLEKFAGKGVIFTDAHAPSSMCSATRYSLLTGRFAHRAYLKNQGWLPHGPNTPMIQRAILTVPEMLQRSGYITAGIGKYHVGMTFNDGSGGAADEYDFSDVDFTKPILDGPTHHGFDEYFGVTGNTEDPLDLEPRIYFRNDRWIFTDRSKMKRIGMKNRSGRVLAMPGWDLKKLGPEYLREAQQFLDRQAKKKDPFFLYYVPNANHFQRNPNGEYAVPDKISGIKIKGASRYSDGSDAGDREDMVLENDVVFGQLLKTLRETDDPRWSGHKLIENTLIIFTSDNGPNVGNNLSTNQESGGLRGKKAKIWEGGIRVPMLVYWKGHIEGGKINRSVCSLTDIYATLAKVIGYSLASNEAQDSHDCLTRWTGENESEDQRPRVFFCHLGPPHSNDTLALRKGSEKLIVNGGLALPSIRKGYRGASVPKEYHDLDIDLYENGDKIADKDSARAEQLAAELLKIHNRGHARELGPSTADSLVIEPGWHNLRNDLTGEIGFEFTVREDKQVTHLGLWDDHARDAPVRPARAVPTEHSRDQPSLSGNPNKRRLSAPHVVRLVTWNGASAKEIVRCELSAGDPGDLVGEFRFIQLDETVPLRPGIRYGLLMSTTAGDGDTFHDPAAFDGISPQTHSDVAITRSLIVRRGDLLRVGSIPGFEDLHPSFNLHRLPVGPNLRLRSQ